MFRVVAHCIGLASKTGGKISMRPGTVNICTDSINGVINSFSSNVRQCSNRDLHIGLAAPDGPGKTGRA